MCHVQSQQRILFLSPAVLQLTRLCRGQIPSSGAQASSIEPLLSTPVIGFLRHSWWLELQITTCTVTTVIWVTVTSQLDFCSSFLAGLPESLLGLVSQKECLQCEIFALTAQSV